MTYILQSYDDALSYILKNGVRKSNRTGVDTLSVFGYLARYDISEFFPVLTKRKMFPKSIFAELLWILSGSSNVNDLEKMGSKIWTPWRNKEFETDRLLRDGELGRIYGKQLREFGLGGFDQLLYLVEQIKIFPESRRLLISYWNPEDVAHNRSRLPPCHVLYQVSIHDGKLSGMLTQRSADFPVGVPANIQFYSALTCLLAAQCGYEPGELVHSTADSHIYVNQIEAVEEYLSRPEIDSPKLVLGEAPSITEYKLEDFNLIDYNPGEKIKMEVVV